MRKLFLLPIFLTTHLCINSQSVVINNPSSCNIGLDLTDGACDPNLNVIPDPDRVIINVNNAIGNTLGVDVYLQEVQLIITHSWTNDLDIRLKSPGGQEIPLSLDNGGGDDNYGDFLQANCMGTARFNMTSCTSIVGASAPFIDQTYRPQGSFYDFNDQITDPNGLWELSICDDAEGDVGRLEYAALVFAPITCLPVEYLELQSQDTTSITINWIPEMSCGTSILEYGPPGFTPGLGTTANGGTVITVNGCPPFELTGLQEDTEYDLYVRKDCSGGNISGNSCPLSFTTGCLPAAPSLRTDFDALALCPGFCYTDCSFDGIWRNSEANDYDWLVNNSNTFTFGTGPVSDASGSGQYIYLEASGEACTDDKIAYLISNCLQLDKQGNDSCHLSFFYHMYGDGIGSLSLQASDNGGFSWTTLWQKAGNQGDEWRKEYISLGDYLDGSILQLRFVGQEGNTSRGDMALDEIIFYGSINQGPPSHVYYADNDSDGFGNSNEKLYSCSDIVPSGYVSQPGDCDDDNPAINPGEEEVPCNNIDENCNGNMDDPILSPPTVSHDTICPGEGAILCASNFERFIFWYDAPTGGNFLGFGDCLFLNSAQLLNNGPVPITYYFYAEDSDGVCTSGSRAVATVIVNPQPNVSLLDNPAICPGTPFDLSSLTFEDAHFTGGTITFHSSLPTIPENELNNTIVNPNNSTNYFFRMSTTGGCFDEGDIPITVEQGPELTFSPSDSFSLCRENQTNISVIPQIAGNYNYQWSTGSTNTEITVESNFMAGATDAYYITVTDEEGCFRVDSVLVNTTVSIDSLRRFVTDVSTCAGNDGNITLIPLDGTSPFSYQWQGTNGITGDSTGVIDTLVIHNLPQGSYRITVTDASEQACGLVLRSVIINGPGAVLQDIDIQNLSCSGANDGQICLSFFGGTPNFAWNNGDTTACIENVPGGNYSVTITEGDCETILEDLIIEEPSSLKVSTELIAPSCHDTNDGSIDITVFGGTPPYSYNWSSMVFFGSNPQNLSAGTYTVTITDMNSCELISSFDLIAPAPVNINLETLESISCTGLMDGSIQLSVNGGTSPYQYIWDNGNSSPLLVNLAAGNYSMTATDFNGCSQTFSASITEPSPVILNLVDTENPECVGEKDGTITVAANGGTPPYAYSWNVPGMDSLLENLAVGTYYAYVTDANNCSPDTLEVELDAVSVLDLDIAVVAPLCEGSATGSITLNPQGTPPFSYAWCHLDTTATVNNLEVGEYCVRIEDGQGCLYDTSIVVEAPQVFGVDFNIVQPTCFGDEDGLIDINIFTPGGVPPYSPPINYVWNDGESGDLRIGIGDGQYVTTISDTQGCEYISDTITIQAPLPLDLAVEGIGIIPCHSDTSGFIEVSIRGGVEPYSYNWVGLDIEEEDLFNIGAGSYRLLVLDDNSCPVDTTFVLEEPAPLSLGISAQSDDICEGGMVEELCGAVNGGILPYELNWSDGSSEDCINMPPPADYILSVTDANGCTEESTSYKVKDFTEAFKLDSFYVTDVNCYGEADGCLIAVVTGGSSNYRYHFSSNDIFEADSNRLVHCGLSPGNYRVTVTDLSTGCTDISEIETITQASNLQFQRDSIDVVNCFGSNDGAIYTSASGGTAPYSYYWENSAGIVLMDSVADISGLVADSYTGYLVDANGCIATVNANVPSVNSLLRDTLVSITPVLCKGDSTGSVQLTILGGAPPYQYEWSNGVENSSIDMLPAGIYSLTITDNDTCVAIFPLYEVDEPESALEVNAILDSTDCYNSSTGHITTNISGGEMPYEYEWTYNGDILPMADSSLLQNIPAGLYELRLEDANDCVRFYEFEIGQPDSLKLNIDLIPPDPPTPGTATAIVEGGTPEYEYHWNTDDMEASIEVLEGDYQVTVTDANNCQTIGSILIADTYEAPTIENALLYPNPTAGQLHLSAQFKQSTATQLIIIDHLGREVHAQQLPKQGSIEMDIDLNYLPSGTYRLLMMSKQGVIYAAGFVKG